jgi:DNA-binding transcriptional ArsR family regulator
MPLAADLPAVLGQTRSRVLRLLADEHTTSEVALLAGIGPASASGHITALHAAGLTTTMRDGIRARHRRTSLGTLLAGECTPIGSSSSTVMS